MKKMKILLLIIVSVFVITACGSKGEENTENDVAASTEQEVDGQAAKQEKVFGTFTSQTLEGEDVTDEIFGKADLTMVNIWGTFCGPCISEMPDLGEISREYEDEGFQMIGMLCDVMESGDETALQIVSETQADYVHLIASEDLTVNALQYISAVPTTVFVDKNGYMVGKVYTGSRSKDAWAEIIDQYLAEVQ